MRLICVALFVASLCLLVKGFAPANAAFECGTFDGKFSCRNTSGGVQRGKAATPGAGEAPPAASEPAPETLPSGEGGLPPPGADTGGSGVTPGPGGCPPSSELLGGKCVRYSATCRKPIAADSLMPSCQGTEEKLVCKPRPDGMKDCCCLVYDKL
ncbi:MAG TPA: hypothetical protein VIG52_11075 [Methyloceanibacter sp.]|jgi:hypothetical protein